MPSPLDDYLNALDRRMLLVPRAIRADSRREIETHLRARAAELEASGLAPADALARALRDFGDARTIGSDLARRHFRHRTVKRLLQCAGALFAVYAVLVLWRLLAGSQPAPSAPRLSAVANPRAELQAIIAAQERAKIGIMSLRCETGVSTKVSTGKYVGTFTNRVEMAYKGEKSWTRLTNSYLTAVNHEQSSLTFIADGKRVYVIGQHGADQTISLRAAGMGRDAPMAFLFTVGMPEEDALPTADGYQSRRVWLADVLTKGKPSVEGASISPTFGPLTVVRLPNARLWFAPSRGNMLVRKDEWQPQRVPAFPGAMYRATVEVTEAANVGGFWLPTATTMRGASTFVGREKSRYSSFENHFTHLAVNDVPDSLFTPLKPGTRVLDFSKPEGRVYVYGTDGRLTSNGIHVFSMTLWQWVQWLVENNWLAFGLTVTMCLSGFGLWAWDVRQRRKPDKPTAA